MISLILLALGLLLILIEFFVPGAIFGVLGSMTLIASVVVFVTEEHSLLAFIAYIAAVIMLVCYLIKFALWRIRSTQPQQSMFADAAQTGYSASEFDKSAIGKHGIVVADLKPGGYIAIGGHKYQAISMGGYLVKDSPIKVISGEGESLIVLPLLESEINVREEV